MSKSLTTETAKDGEVLLPKRDIAIKPIAKKMECNVCGAEADAVFHPTCNCNAGFRSKRQVAAEYLEKNPTASVREIAEQTGVGHGTAQRAKTGVPSGTPEPESTIGRDGKSYPASKPDRPLTEDERREARRYHDERHRADVEAVKRQILKLFLILGEKDRGEVMDLIDRFHTEKLERGE